jgi:hypothetical protein
MARKLKFVAIIIVILFPVGCCIAIFLYARFGGPWAAEQMLPAPSSGRLVGEYTSHDFAYVRNVRMYVVPTSLAEVRSWFGQYTAMSPLPGTLTPDDKTYSSWPKLGFKHHQAYTLHIIAGNIFNPSRGDYYWDDFPECAKIKLYTTVDVIPQTELAPFVKLEPFITGTDESIALISRCWPDH